MSSKDETHLWIDTHLWIGNVTRPHGVRGDMKVRLHFPESDALFQVNTVVLEPVKGEARLYDVEQCRGGGKAVILTLSGVDRIEDVEALRGAKIWVARVHLKPLEPGEYFLVDVIGSRVFLDEAVFAEVLHVRADPSVDTLVLRLNDGSEAEMPLVDAWVKAVDVKAKRVDLLSADGIIQ